MDAFDALNAMFGATVDAGHDVVMPRLYGSAIVHRARNIALTRIRPDADYALFVDDDMEPERGALLNMLAASEDHSCPVISALCTTRSFPVRIVAKAYKEDTDSFHPIDAMRPNKLVVGKFGLGGAFLLVKNSVIEQAKEFYLSGRDWLIEHKPMFDRLGVRNEKRESERQRVEANRRKHYEAEKLLKVFRFSEQDDELERGEDVHFSWLLIHMGVTMGIHTGVQVGHLGDFSFDANLLGVNDAKEVRCA